MNGDVQPQACVQPKPENKSYCHKHAYSDQMLHPDPPQKRNVTSVLSKKEHLRLRHLPGIDSTMGWLSLLRFSLARLLQLCVFRFCSDENGDVWVGVFPPPQKILICCA